MDNPGVDWSLVDYGAGNVYVSSYRRPDASAPAETALEIVEEQPEPGCRWSDCIPFFRCWTAGGEARRAA